MSKNRSSANQAWHWLMASVVDYRCHGVVLPMILSCEFVRIVNYCLDSSSHISHTSKL